MVQIRWVQEIYHTYIVLDIDASSQKDVYGLKIMQNNIPEHFAPFQLRSKDGISQYYYDISGTQNLALQLNKGFTDEKIQCFASALNEALEQCGEYLLNVDNLLLEDSCILYDSDKNTYIFIYYPGYEKDIVCQLKDMAELFLKAVDYTSNESVRKVYEFYHLISDDTNPLRKLNGFAKSSSVSDFGHVPKSTLESQSGAGKVEFLDHRADYPISDSIQEKTLPGEGEDSTEKNSPKAGDNKEMHSSKLWVILAVLLIFEAALSIVALRIFPQYSFNHIVMTGGGVMLLTLTVGTVIFIRTRKSKEENDFWSPSDYINYDMELGGSTTLLTTQTGKGASDFGIVLKSVNPQRYPNLNIQIFPAIIGKEVRDPSCCIQDPTISRKHARLERNGRQFRLTDLRSSNGTFINGELIKPMESVELTPGDDIIFSDLEFIFEISEGKL